MDTKEIKQFDFFEERDNLQKEIKDKISAFLLKCGNSKIGIEIEPRYIQHRGNRDYRLINVEIKLIITS